MTTMLLTGSQRLGWRFPEFAFVLAFSIAGLALSLAVALATWTDGPIVAP